MLKLPHERGILVKLIQSFRNLKASALVGIACILGACTPIPYLDELPEPATVTDAQTVPVVAAIPEPAPAVQPSAVDPIRTTLLLSDDIPEFAEIASEIVSRISSEHLSVHNLDGNPANIARIKAEAAGADRVIAVGLLAATVGQAIQSEHMVFCQVFNYRDHNLLSATSKGVNLLPPFDLQLQQWTALAPDLSRVGIISGPNQNDLIAEIRTAATQQGIDLQVREVSSDKAALYAFKQLTPDIQGIWLLPDNRILSPEVVREIMSYSARHRKQVLVFGRNLLSVGGLMNIASDPADVAEQVLAQLDDILADGTLAGPEMRPLTTLQVEVNPEVARHLGLSISHLNFSAANNDR